MHNKITLNRYDQNNWLVLTYDEFNFFCNDINVQSSFTADYLLFEIHIPNQIHMTDDNIFYIYILQ